ncbi:ABC transporter permease [Paraflavitalea pollutisoli]|uniref:ABC transporter permease n=1 Tax=Paraflavitalea pollutisoli TaxID=3034143 RepID=UPI0023ED8AF1|nr:ABC transporter permease [Paraflavitalea sp. H1-2-19X]
MLKNYWTVAWRSLVRNKLYSLINVLGLALGICACLSIYLIVRHEFSYDTFHPDRDRIFCVDATLRGNHLNSTPGPMASAMRNEMTGFESIAAFQPYPASVTIPNGLQGASKYFEDDGSLMIAEPQYFDILQYHWLSGNARTALTQPHSVVLTASKARKYFGELPADRVIGQTIYYQDSLLATVTGVVADWTNNSDFNYSQWISYATIPVSLLKNEIKLDAWNEMNRSSQILVKLTAPTQPAQINTQFVAFTKRHYSAQLPITSRLQPLSGIHFHPEYGGNGRKASLPVLYTLIAVAGFILLLAMVNFVNLATAQSMKRAREIGVRRVLGSNRSGIAWQFFTETFLLTIAAVLLAALLVTPAFRFFTDLIPAGVHFTMDIPTLLFLLAVTALTTLLAGFYPARVLAHYEPTATLKGITAVPGGGKGRLRKGLIVFQFTISLLFIIASVVVGAQLRYALHTDLGFTTDAILTISSPPEQRLSGMGFASDKARSQQTASVTPAKIALLTEQIRQLAGVEQVIRQWKPPIGHGHRGFEGGRLKNSEERPIKLSYHYGNQDYLPFYGMKLIAGRNLLPSDSTRELLISETGVRALGFSDVSKAIGQQVVINPFETYPIAGVVADFYENSFHQATWPTILLHDPAQEKTIAVKIATSNRTAGDIKTLIDQIEQHWKPLFPGQPMSYAFLDEAIANMYADDLRTERLINIAMAVTVFISCLGLLGLAIFSTARRTREIGIRKVLGASVSGILYLLCKDIVVLILLALAIASPLAWYLMHDWLQGFAYRTSLSAWMFVAAGLAAIGIALLTVGLQALQAARANPVKSLRTE